MILALVLLAGCAQPGQLGHSEAGAAPTSAAGEPGATSDPSGVGAAVTVGEDLARRDAQPEVLGTGTLEAPIELETPGPADYSVRRVIVPAGAELGWHIHPGTETTVVVAGEVTLQFGELCDPVVHGENEAFFVPDAAPHVLRNEGDVAAELVVAYLLAPGAPVQEGVPDACADED